MGNGSLIYGCTLTWEQVCLLIKKHIEKDVEIFEKPFYVRTKLKQQLVQFALFMEDTKREWDYETKKYAQEASKIVITTPPDEMLKQLQAIISKYFAEDLFSRENGEDGKNDENDENDETETDILFQSHYFKIIGAILGLSCVTHGSCCNHDRNLPIVVGFCCQGGPCRGEASGTITMITEDQKKKVDQILMLIQEKAVFLINSDDCDSCT
jgi:hypothetical protein